MHGNILDVVLSNFDLSNEPIITKKLLVDLSSDYYIILIKTHTIVSNTHNNYSSYVF